MICHPYMKSRRSPDHVWHVVDPQRESGIDRALCDGARLPSGPATSVHYPHDGRYCKHCLRVLREEARWRTGLADNWSAFGEAPDTR